MHTEPQFYITKNVFGNPESGNFEKVCDFELYASIFIQLSKIKSLWQQSKGSTKISLSPKTFPSYPWGIQMFSETRKHT